jgi:hypothetical protein
MTFGLWHVILLEQAVGVGPVPHVYLCCAQCQTQTRLLCMHMPSCYTGSLDRRATPWDGTTFAFLGKNSEGFKEVLHYIFFQIFTSTCSVIIMCNILHKRLIYDVLHIITDKMLMH